MKGLTVSNYIYEMRLKHRLLFLILTLDFSVAIKRLKKYNQTIAKQFIFVLFHPSNKDNNTINFWLKHFNQVSLLLFLHSS